MTGAPAISTGCSLALVLAFTTSFSVRGAFAEERPPAAGAYDSLLLAIDASDGTLTGFERGDWVGNGSEKAPQFTCRFALRGTPTAPGRYAIVAWLPGDRIDGEHATIKGELTARDGAVTARLDGAPGGCQYLLTDSSFEADLVTKHPWRSVRVVKSPRAYFYARPSDEARQRMFVVKGDGIGVAKGQPGWVEADYVRDERVVHGWLREGDLFPDQPDR